MPEFVSEKQKIEEERRLRELRAKAAAQHEAEQRAKAAAEAAANAPYEPTCLICGVAQRSAAGPNDPVLAWPDRAWVNDDGSVVGVEVKRQRPWAHRACFTTVAQRIFPRLR